MKITINRNRTVAWIFESSTDRNRVNLFFDLLKINDSLSLDQAQREAEIVKRLAQVGIDAEFVGG